MTASDPHQAHEPGDPFPPTPGTTRSELGMDSGRTIGAPTRLVNVHNVGCELGVGMRASGGLAAPPRPIPAGGDSQHPAERRDRIGSLFPLHKLVPPHRFEVVSRAKKAAA